MAEQHTKVTAGSWLTVVVFLVGFVIGGLGLVENAWWLFWVGVALVAGGFVLGKLVNIMDHVEEVEIQPRGDDERKITAY